MMQPPTIGLCIGDPTGIGPEICAKVLSQPDVLTLCRIRAFGDLRVFQLGQHIAQTSVTCPIVPSLAKVNKTEKLAFIDMQNYDPTDMIVGNVDPTAGQSVAVTLKEIIHLTDHGHLDAVVYAPPE